MAEEFQRKSDEQVLQKDDKPLSEEAVMPAGEKKPGAQGLPDDAQTRHDGVSSSPADMPVDALPSEAFPATVTKKEKKPKKQKNGSKRKKVSQRGTSRGIETMFRVTFQNHIELTGLADNKANTLININGIIISLVIAIVSPRIATNSWMMVPALILTVGCMVSLGYAIFASRPRILSTLISKEKVLRNEAEILFFGNFVSMSVAEFQETMNELLGKRNVLYDNMTRNLYFMGKVLERKYRLLKYSYTVFFITFAMAVVFFIGMFIGMAGQ